MYVSILNSKLENKTIYLITVVVFLTKNLSLSSSYIENKHTSTNERPLLRWCVFTRERSERDPLVNFSTEIAFVYSYIALFLAQNWQIQ